MTSKIEAFENLRVGIETIDKILSGQKVNIGFESPLYKLMQKMHDDGLSPYIAKEFIHNDEHEAVGLSKDQAFMEEQLNVNKKTRKIFKKEGYKNVRLMGGYGFLDDGGSLKPIARELHNDTKRQERVWEVSSAFIAPEKLDLVALRETLVTIYNKAQSLEFATPNSFLNRNYNGNSSYIDKPIILMDEGRYFDKLLNSYGITDEMIGEVGVYKVELSTQNKGKKTKEEAFAVLNKNFVQFGNSNEFPSMDFSGEKNIGDFLGTDSTVKFTEIELALSDRQIYLGAIGELTGKNVPSAEELHSTLAGNSHGLRESENESFPHNEKNTGKQETILSKLQEYSSNKIRKVLEQLGLNTDYFRSWTEDRGGYFGEDGAEIMEYYDYTGIPDKYIHPYNPHPFEEISNYVKAAGGIEGFFKKFHEAADKADEKRAENNRPPVKRTLRGYSIISVAEVKLNPEGTQKAFEWENVKYKLFGGMDEFEVTREPRGFNPETGVLEIEHYKVSDKGEPLMEIPIEQRIKDFSVGKAAKAAAFGLRIPAKRIEMGEDRSRNYVVGIAGGWGEKGSKIAKQIAAQVRAAMGNIHVEIWPGNTNTGLHPIERDFMAKSDVWVNVDVSDSSELTPQQYLDNAWRDANMLVQKQVSPRDKRKPILNFRPESQTLQNQASYISVFDQRFSSHYPPGLWQNFTGRSAPQEMVKAIVDHASTYHRREDIQYFDDSSMKHQKHSRPLVFIGGSAGSENTKLVSQMYEFSTMLLVAGCDICYGVSDRFDTVMGVIGKAVKDWNEKNPKDRRQLIGSTTQEFLSKESLSAKVPLELLDEYHHAPHEVSRLTFQTQKKHGSSMLFGGIGTIEEIIGVMKSTPEDQLVIFNAPRIDGKGRVFDKAIEALRPVLDVMPNAVTI